MPCNSIKHLSAHKAYTTIPFAQTNLHKAKWNITLYTKLNNHIIHTKLICADPNTTVCYA